MLQYILRLANSSTKEKSCQSADVSWPMSYGGNQVLALPSAMEFVADHWLPEPTIQFGVQENTPNQTDG